MEIMYSNSTNNGYFNNKSFIGFLGEASDLKPLINDLNILKINHNLRVKKVISNNIEYLDMLGLNKEILKKRIKYLSSSEHKLIELIKVCNLKPELVILNNFDLGFNYKTKSKISRFIKTVNANYKTNFIIITNDLLFINKNTKHIIISKNKIIKYQGDIISAIKQGIVDKPEIIKFIDLANEHGANLEYTLDNKELLKAIYRSVF